MNKLKSAEELEHLRNKIVSQRDPNRVCLVTSVGTCGLARRSNKVAEAIINELKNQGLSDSIDFRATACHGFCEIEPVVVIYPERILYQHVTVDDVPEIITESIINKKVVERLLYTDSSIGQKIVHEQDVLFYKKQNRLLLDNIRFIDPHKIEDYIALEGYTALAKAVFKMEPEEIIEEIKKSGLRGRGGGGFLTGKKWESCSKAPAPDGIRYLICNADEGDPGAYMDRSLLEGNPHCVIEGMIIGAYGIGAPYGYIYVRYEYPLAVENLNIALKQAREYGLLGENILGSGFDLSVTKIKHLVFAINLMR